jgi:hypothetical protein
MKRLFTIMAAVLLTATIWAQSPQKISFQAVIRNNSNALVTSGTVGMRISILQGSTTGAAVYVETQAPSTNVNGLVSIEIGGGTVVSGNFSAIDWSNGSYFIKNETDPTGGTTYTITGTSQLLSVPYALYAKTAGGHYVGELYGGGIVVSVWKISGVEHGLIASLVDLSAGQVWTEGAYQSTSVSAGALSPTDGRRNSLAIALQAGLMGGSYAAKSCLLYTATGDGGLNDWYLPAAWELAQCYNATLVVNTILGDTNGFQFIAHYWSSTEYDNSYAWHQTFPTGYPITSSKGDSYRVRAVRRF